MVVGYGHEPGSGQDTHQVLSSTSPIGCHPNVAITGYCTYSAGASLGLDVTGTFEPITGVGVEVSASVAFNVETTVSVQAGWVATFGVVKRGKKYFGYKIWDFYDYDQYGNQSRTGSAEIRNELYYYTKYVWSSVGVSQLTAYRM